MPMCPVKFPSLPMSEPAAPRMPWPQAVLGKAVFSLDRHLQRRGGVFPYTSDKDCIFRISLQILGGAVTLENRVVLPAGSPVAELHLWNEQLPLMAKGVTPLQWGIKMSRALAHSLRLLSDYFATRADCDCIRAVRAGMAFGTNEQTAQLLRICGRFGFVQCQDGASYETGPMHRLGENILISMMVLARNPGALRLSSLRRGRVCVFLTRDELDRRFGPQAPSARRKGPV